MKNIFEQKNEMEAEKRKLDKRLKNISIISESQNNISFPHHRINQNANENNQTSNKILEDLTPPKYASNYPKTNLNLKLDLHKMKSLFMIQQDKLFEELEILKVFSSHFP